MTDGHITGATRLDVLFTADRVRSLVPGSPPQATAVLVRAGRIAALGSAADLRREATGIPIVDLPGATLTPGLVEAHIHLTEWALARRQVDLADAASPADAARSVSQHDAGGTGWLLGRGWDENRWNGQRPHRQMLDDAAGSRPVALQSHDMHALWVNSAALAAAGITAATPDPEGGHIQRDATGEPTGLLLEWAGRLVTERLPVPALADAADLVRDAQRELHTFGFTGVHSFPGVHFADPDPLPVLLLLRERGLLRLRVLQHIRADRLDDAIRLGLRSGFGDEWLRIGGVKMFLDGALGSRTAWMRSPYEDGSGCGMNTLPAAEFRATVHRAAAAGIAATVHAIGDAAVSLALDVLGDPALRVPAMPHRIEHVQCCPVERLVDAAAAGITCSVQPCHLMTDWRTADRYWGEARNRGTFAFASLLNAGAVLAFGSDAPVEPVDPRRSLFAAVFRQDAGEQPPGGWFADERISMEAALHGFTTGPAIAAGLSAGQGTLAPGAPADLAAWDTDFIADPAAVRRMRCVTTIVGGETVYTA